MLPSHKNKIECRCIMIDTGAGYYKQTMDNCLTHNSSRFLVETVIRLCREYKDKTWVELSNMARRICYGD